MDEEQSNFKKIITHLPESYLRHLLMEKHFSAEAADWIRNELEQRQRDAAAEEPLDPYMGLEC